MRKSIEDPAVVADNISKTYEVPDTTAKNPSRLGLRKIVSKVDALQSISFVAERGESIGIIGRNGSGKSTLLHLISGGEAPTSGTIYVSDQPTHLGVSPALQQWLTGEQNIYLGCLALGMDSSDAKAAVPEIADWADIGDAIARPMNTYSSGMAARVSFAISTSIHPEILLVDETLSTGDAAFAQKAQDRMSDLLDGAANLFLVMHSSNMVRNICERAIWLHDGRVVDDGPVVEVTEKYDLFTKLINDGKKADSEHLMEEVCSNYVRPVISLV